MSKERMEAIQDWMDAPQLLAGIDGPADGAQGACERLWIRGADAHADPQRVAVKLMRWSWDLTDEQRGGLTSRQFIRYHLIRLQLGEDLTHITYGNMPRRIASVEEVLALKPELAAEVEPSSG